MEALAFALGPGLHHPHQVRLPPHRHHHIVVFLQAQQLAPQAAQVVEGLLRQRWLRKTTLQIRAAHLRGDCLQGGSQIGGDVKLGVGVEIEQLTHHDPFLLQLLAAFAEGLLRCTMEGEMEGASRHPQTTVDARVVGRRHPGDLVPPCD